MKKPAAKPKSLRVIAGTARGLRLASPSPGLPIRPTLDRVREAVFNILGPRLPQARFLDLFSGTGANGIEALSRGAAHACFVDGHSGALAIIRENLAHTRLDAQANCLYLRLPEELHRLSGPFDIIYADPPHTFPAYAALLQGMGERTLLTPEGILVLEHARRMALEEGYGALHRVRQASYGETAISFFALES